MADGIYIQRKNIEKVQHEATEGMEAYTDWECDSREITVSEYQMLESIKQINTDKAIDDYTAQLITRSSQILEKTQVFFFHSFS